MGMCVGGARSSLYSIYPALNWSLGSQVRSLCLTIQSMGLIFQLNADPQQESANVALPRGMALTPIYPATD